MNHIDHKIINKPWEYRIVSFLYECSSIDNTEHYIEMWLCKDSEIKKLRFTEPRQLKIEDGFPQPTHGMEILDISNRGLENLNVLVSDFELSSGAITFYARDVIEI